MEATAVVDMAEATVDMAAHMVLVPEIQAVMVAHLMVATVAHQMAVTDAHHHHHGDHKITVVVAVKADHTTPAALLAWAAILKAEVDQEAAIMDVHPDVQDVAQDKCA